jgi:hypothetical protein
MRFWVGNYFSCWLNLETQKISYLYQQTTPPPPQRKFGGSFHQLTRQLRSPTWLAVWQQTWQHARRRRIRPTTWRDPHIRDVFQTSTLARPRQSAPLHGSTLHSPGLRLSSHMCVANITRCISNSFNNPIAHQNLSKTLTMHISHRLVVPVRTTCN